MAMEAAQRTCPVPCPGPATSPMALRGAYAVQPERGGPLPTKNDATNTMQPTNVTQKSMIFTGGDGIFLAAPWKSRKEFPNAAKGKTLSTKKTMIVACMVIN